MKSKMAEQNVVDAPSRNASEDFGNQDFGNQEFSDGDAGVESVKADRKSVV